MQFAGYFLDFVRKDPVVQPIVAELDAIIWQKYADSNDLVDVENHCLRLPQQADECASLYLQILQLYSNPEADFPHFFTVFGRGSSSFQDMSEEFFEQVLGPLCSYIDERIDDGDLLLYSLTRYRRECQWFETGTISQLVESADSRKLEEVLDSHLRAWLFREGIDFPFSTPKSPAGRADIVVWQGEEPLPIEVKVYDGENRDLGHVSQGLWQAQRYAHDYGKPFGYLVVFNTSDHLLSFDATISKDGPPCVPVGGLNVFAVVINTTDRASASKEKPVVSKVVPCPGSNTGSKP
ncbi:hypothetical protein [Anatilimnocola floriformis]|uniref:hypothetical protein n=1 Tax=Anatilimnocola floriformis TaxID=2948575 RepID=UPI0020C239E5|nr:hypothetical protein [Anatilimnocola floriformis]